MKVNNSIKKRSPKSLSGNKKIKKNNNLNVKKMKPLAKNEKNEKNEVKESITVKTISKKNKTKLDDGIEKKSNKKSSSSASAAAAATTTTTPTNKIDDELIKHKNSLKQLQKIDPEFYKYLENNDRKLLAFNVDDNIDDDGDNDEDENENEDAAESEESDYGDDEEDDSKVHKPSGKLEVASDESDFEQSDVDESGDDDDDKKKNKNKKEKKNVITLKLLKQWQTELNEDKIQIDTIKNCIEAFNSALISISSATSIEMPQDKSKSGGGGGGANAVKKTQFGKYKVEGSAVFNGVLQLCILNIQPAIKRYLGLKKTAATTTPQHMKSIHKCKKWSRIKAPLRLYLIDLVKLIENISSQNILIIVLKHLNQLSDMLTSFTTIIKPILKRLVILWSTNADETIRILSFICILKITRSQQQTLLPTILKAMYMSYTRNSKFVSSNTLPGINFMRRSLSEMLLLDLNVSYQHVFLYIRQLAIHLRNAITLKKKESYTSVYNWPFINSLRLWVELLSSATTSPTNTAAATTKSQLQPLLFPLINILIGVIKLIPTAQYFPLRFHCTQMLIDLTKQTGHFIPVLPHLWEILQSATFNRKHSKLSVKPLKFTFILRLNKQQLAENSFRDECIELFQEQTLQLMSNDSNKMAYPEMIIPFLINLKQYIKSPKCKNINYSRKLKVLCDKLEENLYFIEKQRESYQFSTGMTLNDISKINAWETNLLTNKIPPLLTYYRDWSKTHEKLKKRIAMDIDNDKDSMKLPKINRKRKQSTNNDDGPVELFPSDDDEDDGDDDEDNDDNDKQIKFNGKSMKKKGSKVIENDPDESDENDVDVDDLHNVFDDTGDILKDFDINDW